MIKEFPKNIKELTPEELQNELMKYIGKKGFIYGFNFILGPQGKPIIDSFGNLKKEPLSGKTKVDKTREPLVEVYEEGELIIVIAEMPGVVKEDIELKATNRSLTITTK